MYVRISSFVLIVVYLESHTRLALKTRYKAQRPGYKFCGFVI